MTAPVAFAAALSLSLSAPSSAPVDVCGVPGQPSTVVTTVRTAFSTWNQAGANAATSTPPCTNLNLSFQGTTPSVQTGYDGQNLVVFRQGLCSTLGAGDPCLSAGTCADKFNCWDDTNSASGHASGVIGLTTTTFRPSTGEILDADMELNAWNGSAGATFATAVGFYFTCVNPVPASLANCNTGGGNCCAAPSAANCLAMDVQNTVTHEAGHFIGFAHNTVTGSTMNPTASRGETSKRTLGQIDIDGVCDVYQAQAHTPVNTGYVRTTTGGSPGVGLPLAWANPTVPFVVNDFTNVVGSGTTTGTSSSSGCGQGPAGSAGLLALVGLWALRRRRATGRRDSAQ